MVPWTFQDFANGAFSVVGTLALVIAVNLWTALAVVPLAVAFFFLRRYVSFGWWMF